jgi:hypothetical protein
MSSTLKGDTLSKSVTPIDSLDRRLKAKLDVEPRPFECPFLGGRQPKHPHIHVGLPS